MKQTLNLAILSIVQIILGLLSNVIIIRFYGIGRETDLFISAQALPFVISNIVTTSLNSVWLGTLSEQRESKLKWHYILSKSLGQALILSILISSVFLIILKPINQLIFGGIENIENS